MRQLWSDRGTTGAVAHQHRERRRADQELEGRRLARLPARDEGLEARRRARSTSTSPRSSRAATARCRARASSRSSRAASRDVRRPDYETIVGFGAEPPERRHRARHRLPRRLQPLRHRRGQLERDARAGCARRSRRASSPPQDLDGIDMRWGNGEARARADDQDGHRRGLRRVAAARRRRAPRSTSARAASASPSTSTAASPRTTTRASPR